MSNEVKAIAEPSLKVLYCECMEILDILCSTEEKLNYAVNGATPKDTTAGSLTSESPVVTVSIGMLNSKIQEIRRISSNHAKLVNALTGN